jgi:Rps23 Pro-64 3,4-dihydroxylase Tpa1-like proline 4-hydroxylase
MTTALPKTHELLSEPFVFDDAMPHELVEGLLGLEKDMHWYFGHTTLKNPNNVYWHREIAFGTLHNRTDMHNAVFSSYDESHPVRAYIEWLESWLVPKSASLLRYYFNAHTYGTDGSIHQDSKEKTDLTVVHYVTRDWDIEWGGETVVLDENKDIALSVLPRRNRLLTFPSCLEHGPRALTKSFNKLRIVLVAKYHLKD